MSEQNVSDRVKGMVDEYIRECFTGDIPPSQLIELRLTFYAGMMIMLAEMIEIGRRHKGDRALMANEVIEFREAVMSRAMRLNDEKRAASL